MDPLTVSFIGPALMLLLLLLGVHIGFSLLISGFIGLLVILHGFQPAIKLVVSAFYYRISLALLVVLPLFVLMGYLASAGGISTNIYNSLGLWLRKFRSGLGIATVVACTAFGTVCGSSLVTAAVFTKISAPEMRRCGYEKRLAYGICASAGAIGMLIPPSILAVVYGMLSGVPISKVLMAGVAPGLLLTFGFSALIIIIGKIRPTALGDVSALPSVTWRQRLVSLKDWWSVVIVAVCIFGGIYGGVFSPTEASAFAAFALLVVYFFISLRSKSRRKGIRKELSSIFSETATTSAMIFLICGGAAVFSDYVALTGITKKVSVMITNAGLSAFSVVLLIMGILLILGCFLDSMSILCLTVPVFNPIINDLGVDPIWYATVVILAIECGLLTPPFGLNVFAAKAVAEPDVKLEDVFGGSYLFLIIMLLTLALLLAVPRISTFLPGFLA